MIFGKPKILIFLKRQSMAVVGEDKKIQTLDLKEDVYSDLEVINHGNFVKQVSDFFKRLQIKKNEGVLVMAKEIVFEKYVETLDLDTSKIEEAFFASVPFESKHMIKKVIRDSKGIRMIGVNGDLIRTVILALTPMGIRISAVLPATIFKISGEGNAIGVADAAMIMANSQAVVNGNLIENKKPKVAKREDGLGDFEEDNSDSLDKPRFNQKILLIVGVALILGACVIILSAFGIVKNPFAKKQSKTGATNPSQVDTLTKPTPKQTIVFEEVKESTREVTQGAKDATNTDKLAP